MALASGIAGIRLGVADPAGAAAWHRNVAIEPATTDLIGLHTPAPPELAVNESGCLHICLRTADVDAAWAKLESSGARFTSQPVRSHAGPAIAYFHDPAGIQFQLIELASGPLAGVLPPPSIELAVGALHHVGMTVDDLGAALAWFGAVLELETVVRTSGSGPDAARPLGLSDVSYEAAVLTLGEHWLELLAFDDPSDPEERVAAATLAIAVSDIDELDRRIEAHGRAPVGPHLEFHQARRHDAR